MPEHLRKRGPQQLLSALTLLLCSLLLVAGCSKQRVMRADDTRPVAEVVSYAEDLVKHKSYASAAVQYAIAIEKDPTVGKNYLRRSEILERIDRDKDARKVYKLALEKVPEDDPDHSELVLRLALINANHLYRLDEAEELLFSLPNSSIERHDLAAFLYYQAAQYEAALELLNKALQQVREADQKALLMYHASLIYHGLEDEKNTFGSLYHAINLSEHLGLIRDIENFWELINEKPLGETGLPKD